MENIQSRQAIKGYDFDNELNMQELVSQTMRSGLQGSEIGKAINIIKDMIAIKQKDPKAKVFLGYTSNMISCGLREIIRFLCEHKMVDAIVTTCGGLEEDIMKCFLPAYIGTFRNNDSQLKSDGINRIGNMYVPNENYCKFEDFILEVIADIYPRFQKGENFTPSSVIREMGKKVQHKESVYYWCYENNIPVFCPAITDGAIGDAFFFQSYKNEDFIFDVVGDVIKLNELATQASHTSALILGAGLVKHTILQANQFRGGLDICVLINNGMNHDGSDSGASWEQEILWKKVKKDAKKIKVFAEVSLVFPLIVGETFAKSIQFQLNYFYQLIIEQGMHVTNRLTF